MIPPRGTPAFTTVAAEVSESALLKRKLELVLPPLLVASRHLAEHPKLRELYPSYLFMSHCIIRASVPLMETASRICRAMPGDPVSTLLTDYLERHIEEERGHDTLLLEDLAMVGLPPEWVLDRPPWPSIAALVGSQYYWVHHAHPVGLLGYIALLEGYPPVRKTVEDMQFRTKYDPEAFRTLLLHSDLDPHHGEELDGLIDSLTLTDEQRSILGMSATSTARQFTNVIEDLITNHPPHQRSVE